MISTVIMILVLVKELFNFLKGELKGKTDFAAIVAIVVLMIALFLKSVGL